MKKRPPPYDQQWDQNYYHRESSLDKRREPGTIKFIKAAPFTVVALIPIFGVVGTLQEEPEQVSPPPAMTSPAPPAETFPVSPVTLPPLLISVEYLNSTE